MLFDFIVPLIVIDVGQRLLGEFAVLLRIFW